MPPDAHLIAPTGELDVGTVDQFAGALAEASDARDLVVDLSEVEFIDSTGLRAVVEANERALRARRRCLVVAPRGSTAGLALTLTGLRQGLTVVESRAGAGGLT